MMVLLSEICHEEIHTSFLRLINETNQMTKFPNLQYAYILLVHVH